MGVSFLGYFLVLLNDLTKTMMIRVLIFVVFSFLEFALTHVDEYIDELLTTDYSCDIALPRIKKRYLSICIFVPFAIFILFFIRDTSRILLRIYVHLKGRLKFCVS